MASIKDSTFFGAISQSLLEESAKASKRAAHMILDFVSSDGVGDIKSL